MAIITISRGSMSGGEALASCLAGKLGYRTVAREVLVEAAAKIGASEQTLTQKFESSPGLWGRLTSNRRLYVIAVQAALAEQVLTDDLVYHGHAGHLLLKGVPNVLRVRLIAPIEMRARAVEARQNISREAAMEYIREVDEDRVRWTKLLYAVDWRDPALYDVVLNLETMTIPTACSALTGIVKQPDYATTPDTTRRVEDFVLGCRVRLALASDPRTRAVEFDVKASGGVVSLQGEMPNAGMMTHVNLRDQQWIVETVRGIPGVKEVRLNMETFDAYH
ncbi:MAG: cytidylate kinase family protein [Deltaproteobacteria bacterium]|nr:cytidylate kinase family protein [Deltaproteobacteria bacterium]